MIKLVFLFSIFFMASANSNWALARKPSKVSSSDTKNSITSSTAGRIETLMKEEAARQNIPGLVVTIATKEGTAFSRAIGLRNLEKNLPMTPDTLYGIASQTKTFTALAIMNLAKENKISIEDPLRLYMDLTVDDAKDPIRIRHVLSQTTGFSDINGKNLVQYRSSGLAPKNLGIADTWSGILTYINGAQDYKLAKPGVRYGYSNDFYSLLGLVIEKVTKRSYSEYMENEILKPLGMHRSVLRPEAVLKDQNLIQGYSGMGRDLEPSDFPFTKLGESTGGIFSTGNEMAQYVQVLLDDSERGISRLVTSLQREDMWRPQSVVTWGFGAEIGSAYGFGWRVTTHPNHRVRVVEHGGDFIVAGGHILLVPERGFGIVVGMNRQPGQRANKLMKQILEILLEPKISKSENEIIGEYVGYCQQMKISISKEKDLLILKTDLPEGMGGKNVVTLKSKDQKKGLYTFEAGLGGEMMLQTHQSSTGRFGILFDRFLLYKK